MAEAQLLLGDFYSIGRGIDRDMAAARFWYNKAAAHGNSTATAKLARLG